MAENGEKWFCPEGSLCCRTGLFMHSRSLRHIQKHQTKSTGTTRLSYTPNLPKGTGLAAEESSWPTACHSWCGRSSNSAWTKCQQKKEDLPRIPSYLLIALFRQKFLLGDSLSVVLHACRSPSWLTAHQPVLVGNFCFVKINDMAASRQTSLVSQVLDSSSPTFQI